MWVTSRPHFPSRRARDSYIQGRIRASAGNRASVASESSSALPPELKSVPISFDQIRDAQLEDPECIGLRLKLRARDKRVEAQFEDIDGVLSAIPIAPWRGHSETRGL